MRQLQVSKAASERCNNIWIESLGASYITLLTATGVLFHRRDVQVEQRNVTNMAAALVQAVQRRPQHYTMRQLRDGFKGNQPSKYKQGTARVAHTGGCVHRGKH